jgi:sulfide:quinone oxidoreductase
VAAVEAILALREIFEAPPHIDLVAPNRRFVYQPLAVAEPFGLARSRLFSLDAIARDLGAELRVCSLLRVDAKGRRVLLADGTSLRYDAALIAVGGRRRPWLPGAIPFGGADDAPEFTALLARLEDGSVSRVGFTMPPPATWALPLYELALLTAGRIAERAIAAAELLVVTPEVEPLALFGRATSGMLRGMLADRGIVLRAGATADAFQGGRLRLSHGASVELDAVVALSRLSGPRLPGLPADAEGFIRVDEYCRVDGAARLYAAGDGTAFEIKQGGLAAQQADVAAEAIAVDLGAPVRARPFVPMLRAMLLTGVAPMYLRSMPGDESGERSPNPLWWPPSKIAARHLGSYLQRVSSPLRQVEPHAQIDLPAQERPDHGEAVRLALTFAEADADDGDFESALRWLEVAERLAGGLSSRWLELRESWHLRLAR